MTKIRTSVIRRFAWSLAFLASLTLLILQSSNRVRYYLERPHVTKLDEISGGILTFPAVTICNLNEFRFNQLTKNDMYYAGEFMGFLDETRQLHPVKGHIYDILQSLTRCERKSSTLGPYFEAKFFILILYESL